MFSWIVIIAGLLVSSHFADLNAQGSLRGVLAPLGVMVFSIALLIKIVFALGPASGRNGGGGFGGDGGGGFGGDGGGCGGGDGGGC